MTIYLDTVANAGLDLAGIVSVRAGHAGSCRLPVVTVTEAGRLPRIFRFADEAARDRFAAELQGGVRAPRGSPRRLTTARRAQSRVRRSAPAYRAP